mgnify:CR=1 FL=1
MIYVLFIIHCFRKAELALENVQIRELTQKGMIFDRFAVAYGIENKIN